MKNLILISFSLLSLTCLSKEVETSDYWQIVSVIKDTSIEKSQSKIKIFFIDKSSLKPLHQVKVFINTDLLIGESDTNGIIISTFPYGENKFCADTPEGNSFTTNYRFLDQHYYVVTVIMNKYKNEIIYENGLYPIADKPVIYLYPTKKQKINVKVIPKDEFLFTYPQYPENGWDVIARPTGKIDFENRTYNYLFWEGMYPPIIEQKEQTGFIVNSDTLIQFFENTLTTIGLNHEEQADFITYWGPKLMENQLNFIHFYFNEDYEKYIAKLKITPKPETLIRVFMTYQIVDEERFIEPQSLPIFKRKGFTVVEWGGSYN